MRPVPVLSGDVSPLFLRSRLNLSGTAPKGRAAFGALRCAHLAGIRFYELEQKAFTFRGRKRFFRTPDLPASIEAKQPSICIMASHVGVANHIGYGPLTGFPLAQQSEPHMPGLRTCNGGAHTFQPPGPLTVQENVVIPMKAQDAAAIRCVYV